MNKIAKLVKGVFPVSMECPLCNNTVGVNEDSYDLALISGTYKEHDGQIKFNCGRCYGKGVIKFVDITDNRKDNSVW
jgi:hypothetical protein